VAAGSKREVSSGSRGAEEGGGGCACTGKEVLLVWHLLCLQIAVKPGVGGSAKQKVVSAGG
jgi:hypothetical protein